MNQLFEGRDVFRFSEMEKDAYIKRMEAAVINANTAMNKLRAENSNLLATISQLESRIKELEGSRPKLSFAMPSITIKPTSNNDNGAPNGTTRFYVKIFLISFDQYSRKRNVDVKDDKQLPSPKKARPPRALNAPKSTAEVKTIVHPSITQYNDALSGNDVKKNALEKTPTPTVEPVSQRTVEEDIENEVDKFFDDMSSSDEHESISNLQVDVQSERSVSSPEKVNSSCSPEKPIQITAPRVPNSTKKIDLKKGWSKITTLPCSANVKQKTKTKGRQTQKQSTRKEYTTAECSRHVMTQITIENVHSVARALLLYPLQVSADAVQRYLTSSSQTYASTWSTHIPTHTTHFPQEMNDACSLILMLLRSLASECGSPKGLSLYRTILQTIQHHALAIARNAGTSQQAMMRRSMLIGGWEASSKYIRKEKEPQGDILTEISSSTNYSLSPDEIIVLSDNHLNPMEHACFIPTKISSTYDNLESSSVENDERSDSGDEGSSVSSEQEADESLASDEMHMKNCMEEIECDQAVVSQGGIVGDEEGDIDSLLFGAATNTFRGSGELALNEVKECEDSQAKSIASPLDAVADAGL
jgi:hypothetical protein